MNGFGLYETLRLILPGALAVAIVTAVLRLATGHGPLLANGPHSELVDSLQGATFLFASVLAGFVLYLLDIPTRARIYGGDPVNGIVQPTEKMSELLANSIHADRSFSLYFTLSDSRMPPEMHRRVYFFGSLYRIYFDARVLAAAGVAIGGPFALHAALDEHAARHLAAPFIWAAILLAVMVIVIAVVGEVRHAVSSINAHEPGRNSRLRDYLSRVSKRSIGLVWSFLAIAGIGSVGVGALLLLSEPPAWVGILTGVAAFGLWLAIELGPRRAAADTLPADPLRNGVLWLLRAPADERAQYPQIGRGMMDLALFGPAIVAAASAADLQGRPAEMVLAWGVLVIPATMIMGIRKHEDRLLKIYKDQVAWLEVHASQIVKLVDGADDEWC